MDGNPKIVPATCYYGETFTLANGLLCTKGEHTHIRDNKIRNSFCNMLHKVCDVVEVEP